MFIYVPGDNGQEWGCSKHGLGLSKAWIRIIRNNIRARGIRNKTRAEVIRNTTRARVIRNTTWKWVIQNISRARVIPNNTQGCPKLRLSKNVRNQSARNNML